MKLRNKKTGEIKDACEVLDMKQEDGVLYKYYSLAELNSEWEDYEEPKEDYILVIENFIYYAEEADDTFYCDESVKKFIEKLKAWKRLKDKGFRFDCWYGGSKSILFSIPQEIIDTPTAKDLDLLFGGEE